jgi:hypothetical protein
VQHFLGVKSDFLGKPSYPPLPFLA